MFAPKDQKAKFRVGTKVFYEYNAGSVYKITRKDWSANGTLTYTIEGEAGQERFVREKDLWKAM